jgi:hypothetical protein
MDGGLFQPVTLKERRKKNCAKARRWRERRREQWLCIRCTHKAEPLKRDPKTASPYCRVHTAENRDRVHKRMGCTRRYRTQRRS